MTQTLFVTIALLALAIPVMAGDGNGGYAGAYYQVPIGARPTAMGGAYRAVSNDGAAPLYNPAGLATLTNNLIGSSYRLMGQDRQLGYVSAIFSVQGQSALGVHWLYAGSGSATVRDADGFDLGREISFNNHEFGIVFAKRFEKTFALGVNLNYLQASYPEEQATSVGFDFGAVVYVDQFFDRERREDMAVQDIRLAATVRHINKEFKWDSEKYNIRYTVGMQNATQKDRVPIEFALAASARFLDRRLLVAVDVAKDEKLDPALYAGAEFFVRPEFALRSGYSNGRFAAGTGYIFAFGNTSLAVDYAFSTDRVGEGSEHIFSFDVLFK